MRSRSTKRFLWLIRILSSMWVPKQEEILLAFYRGDGRDIEGRTHAEILAWSDARFEAVHDYIQWLFPLPEPSGANPLAPLLTPGVAEAFRESEEMRSRLRAAYTRMLSFYGLVFRSHGEVVPAAFYPQRAQTWLTPWNHNHLRLTRILRSLRLLGLEQESAALFGALEQIYEAEPPDHWRISAETFRYWQRAIL